MGHLLVLFVVLCGLCLFIVVCMNLWCGIIKLCNLIVMVTQSRSDQCECVTVVVRMANLSLVQASATVTSCVVLS